MKNKFKIIFIAIAVLQITVTIWLAHELYYKKVYADGFNKAAEVANVCIDINNLTLDACLDSPRECGPAIIETLTFHKHIKLK